MADYHDTVHKLLYGIIAGLAEIEKRKRGNTHAAPKRPMVVFFLHDGDLENLARKKMLRPEDYTKKN